MKHIGSLKEFLSILLLFTIFNISSLISQETKFAEPKQTKSELGDTLWLNNGWNWISFPSIGESKGKYKATEPILDKINLYPKINIFIEGPDQHIYKQWDFKMLHWQGNLDKINALSGYIMKITPVLQQKVFVVLSGKQLPVDTEITIQPEKINWISYFMPNSQYPWKAFPDSVYNSKLSMIKTQHWAMFRDPETQKWIKSGKIAPIKYGDMVKVSTSSEYPVHFNWNNTSTSQKPITLNNPQEFNWEEKEDYTPFYIKIDGESQIAEIALTVDGKCIGASVRNPEDTLIEVDGYTLGNYVGSELDFKVWDRSKINTLNFSDYAVWNPLLNDFEKRKIHISELQEYYQISLRKKDVNDVRSDLGQLTCYTDNIKDVTHISFRLNISQGIKLEIFDIADSKVNTVLDGKLSEGYYEIKWDNDNFHGIKVGKGVYYCKITTASGYVITRKIILLSM